MSFSINICLYLAVLYLFQNQKYMSIFKIDKQKNIVNAGAVGHANKLITLIN